jgi:hypothetical protein
LRSGDADGRHGGLIVPQRSSGQRSVLVGH